MPFENKEAHPMKSHLELKNEMQAEIAEAVRPITEQIEAKWKPALEAARRLEANREFRYKDEVYKAAVEAALWPIGTKLEEWTNTEGRFAQRSIPWKPTGRTGFYEIYHEKKSVNVARSMSQGKPFVRLAKKDGSPGSRAETWVHWQSWIPEGLHPDTYEHPANKERDIKV